MHIDEWKTFPDNFTLDEALYSMARKPFHGRICPDEDLITELHRLTDAFATLNANIANFLCDTSQFNLDATNFFENISWWIGYTDTAKSSKLIADAFTRYLKQPYARITGPWGLITLVDESLILYTNGVQKPGYQNPLVTGIHQHKINDDSALPNARRLAEMRLIELPRSFA